MANEFNVWVTIVSGEEPAPFLAALEMFGWSVRPLSSSATYVHESKTHASSVVALVAKLGDSTAKSNVSDVLSDVESSLKHADVSYLSIVISEHTTTCTWQVGNKHVAKESLMSGSSVPKRTTVLN